MGLTVKPISAKHRKLMRLIHQFNKIPTEDVVQRLFYLQKINYHINSIPIYEGEFTWLTAKDDESWHAHLLTYGINPDASFLFKGIQFAKAVAAQITTTSRVPDLSEQESNDIVYQLMQERDALLNSTKSFDEIKTQFMEISYRLSLLAEKNSILKETLDEQSQILSLAKDKISLIKGEKKEAGQEDPGSSDYTTEILGEEQVNNYNFKFKMKAWKKYLVIRVEDRNNLNFEQELHAYPVAKYFANDIALFMMQFKSDDSTEIEYKPVVLSQFANQGSLVNVAETLKGKSQQKIAATAKHYFTRIYDFCLKLKEAGAYHPDIKLSNFLVHNQKVLVSDRKTFVRSPNPLASDLRSTPRYAPPQYLECLDEACKNYSPKARTTRIDVEQLMSYQIGMALKEFLIVTQLGAIPTDSSDKSYKILTYFQKPNRAITNLSILVDELTRYEEGKRLTIEQFHRLLPFLNHNSAEFNKQLEQELSAKFLGIESELQEIEKLLHPHMLKNTDFLKQANAIFGVVSERTPKDPRLNRMSEQLATKCYKNYSEHYFSKISQEIETALFDKDWISASWWRKIIHTLSFGFFSVGRVATAEQIDIKLDYNDPVFQTHFIQFEFLPPEELNRLGITEANNLRNYFIEHLDEIRPLNSSDSSEEEPVDASPQEDPTGIDALKPAATSKPKGKINKKQSMEELLSTETIVVKEGENKKPEGPSSALKKPVDPVTSSVETEKEKPAQKKRTSVDLAENHRFFAALANTKKKGSAHRVLSTILRGEKKSLHPTIQEIFGKVKEKQDESERTTTGLSQ